MFEIIQDDCLEAMDRLGDEGRTFNAVVADPPYCSGGITPAACRGGAEKYIESCRRTSVYYQKNGSFDDGMTSHAYYLFTRAWIIKARRLLTSPGYIFIFTDWRMISVISAAMQGAGVYQRGVIPWEKGNARPNRGQISQTSEFILWGTKDAAKSEKYVTKGTISEPPPPPSARIHPTEKNARVYRRLYEILDDDAHAVFDPFCGSGAAGIAAIERGLEYVGVDCLEEYAKKARERLEKHERGLNGRKEDPVY